MAGKLKIKYCIWDVGGVIYPYTLKFVNEFMKSRTEDMAAREQRCRRFRL